MAKKKTAKSKTAKTKHPAFPVLRQPSLRNALADAEGRSEFVIVVFVDIRGFSKFSQMHESPDMAMLIKRFYVQLIDEYYTKASFFKPTGDGLLIVYPYNERTLESVANDVVTTTLRCLQEFPSMLQGDPMINFETPENLGFGIARGTACRLHSGKTLIDYSGHLLNLAARLMELARPSGIVIDGSFGEGFIPEAHRDEFEQTEVYLRSLAEKEPVEIFFHSESVKLEEAALRPLKGKNWKTHKKTFKVTELSKIGDKFIVALPDHVSDVNDVSVMLTHPMMHRGRVVEGYNSNSSFKKFEVVSDPDVTKIRLDLKSVRDTLATRKVPRTRNVTFKITYVASR